MDKKQEKIFWETIDIFDKQGLLPYIMIMFCKNFIEL